MRSRVQPIAQEDVDAAAAFIANRNFAAGARFLDAFRITVARIEEHPRLGRSVPLPHPAIEVRSVPVAGFRTWRVFYHIHAGVVVVIRVLHGARDIGAFLADDLAGPDTDDADAGPEAAGPTETDV